MGWKKAFLFWFSGAALGNKVKTLINLYTLYLKAENPTQTCFINLWLFDFETYQSLSIPSLENVYLNYLAI